MINNQKYLKYLLTAGMFILIFLVVLSLIVSRLPKKTSVENIQSTGTSILSTQSQNTLTVTKQPAFRVAQAMQDTVPSMTPSNSTFTNQIAKISIKSTLSPFLAETPSISSYNNDPEQTIGQVLLNLPTPTPLLSGKPTLTANPVRPFVNALNTLFSNGSTENVQTNSEPQAGTGTNSGLTYYPQCDGPYDTYSLAGGCNICQAGCGQTTSAMILSSYVSKRFTPPIVADLYKQNGVTSGCNGTNIMDAQTIMKQNNLITTDLIVNTSPDNTQILEDFKSYLKSGWTLFTLGRYCDNGCGHFFWIVDIDADNNVWTYDPFYGRKQIPPPFNENQYSPFPYYRVAFGVKKP